METAVECDLLKEAGLRLRAFAVDDGYVVHFIQADGTRLLAVCSNALPHLLTALLWVKESMSPTLAGAGDRSARPVIPRRATVDASATGPMPAFDGLG